MTAPDIGAHIPEMVDRIVRGFDPERVILFGSRARGDNRPDSDVDLLVVLDEAPDKRKTVLAIREKLRDLPGERDIVVFTPAEIADRGHLAGTILRPALREGRICYRRRGAMTARDEALRWMKYAEEDLAVARALLSDESTPPRHACYNAQQAAEKALKAAIALMDIEPPKSHNLDSLRFTLPGGWHVQGHFPELSQLTDWNAMGRYPGAWPEATRDDAAAALELAEGVYECIRKDFVIRQVFPS